MIDQINDISWLYTSPSGEIVSPVDTKKQMLPFESLRWEDFEKLCFRLASLESNVESCRQYGIPGDKQHGIDIFARGDNFEKYHVYQCKNEKDFGPQKIRDAVAAFKNGEWYEKSEIFVLCTRESLQPQNRTDTLEEQSKILAKDNKKIVPWDGPSLSIKLKSHPELVDDFFGREWVKHLCGSQVADSLSDHLDVKKLAELRSKLFSLYDSAFNIHDPGIPLPKSIPLSQRYVIPDIQDIYTFASQAPPKDSKNSIETPASTTTLRTP